MVEPGEACDVFYAHPDLPCIMDTDADPHQLIFDPEWSPHLSCSKSTLCALEQPIHVCNNPAGIEQPLAVCTSYIGLYSNDQVEWALPNDDTRFDARTQMCIDLTKCYSSAFTWGVSMLVYSFLVSLSPFIYM